MIRRLFILIATLALAAAACGDDDGGDGPAVALDGTPRIADAEGWLVDVEGDFATLTLDGDRTYDVDDDLLAFAAADGSVQPLLRLVDQYVQVGLDGDTVEWIGALSSVIEVPGEPTVAYFTDVLTEVDDGRAIFRSGTVLTLGSGAEVPAELPAAVLATIDVSARTVVALAPA